MNIFTVPTAIYVFFLLTNVLIVSLFSSKRLLNGLNVNVVVFKVFAVIVCVCVDGCAPGGYATRSVRH